MQYELIYNSTFPAWPLGVSVAAAVGLAVLLLGASRRSTWMVALGTAWAVSGALSSGILWVKHVQCMSVPAQVVEGRVEVLSVQAFDGHSLGDVLDVGGHRVVVDSNSTRPGYSVPIARGGALRDGVHARLVIRGDRAMRVEVVP